MSNQRPPRPAPAPAPSVEPDPAPSVEPDPAPSVESDPAPVDPAPVDPDPAPPAAKPFLSAGVADDLEQFGKAVDPATGGMFVKDRETGAVTFTDRAGNVTQL